MAEIRLTGINKVFPDGTHAVHDVDLHIADGEFMIMVGPSGCAKSTILRMVAGLETPTTGVVEIGGRVVNDVAPKDRDIAMIFQSYALYPHMTVAENMAFGLKLRHMPAGEIEQRIQEAARILGLEELLHRRPKQLSGGQRQRVAMGRAIVREPQAFLMDEPLSNLDAKLRVQMRAQIAKLHARLGTTTMYVTHDQVEAMTLGQRICILRKGVVQQVDAPDQVYCNPANVFVAGFIGSPGMNFMLGTLLVQDGALYIQLGDRVMPVPAQVSQRLSVASDVHGMPIIAGIRPEHVHASQAPGASSLVLSVELVETMGSEAFAYALSGIAQPDLSQLSDTQAAGSEPPFIARLTVPHVGAGPGDQLMVDLDLTELHLFDPRSQFSLLAPRGPAQAATPITIRTAEPAAVASAARFTPAAAAAHAATPASDQPTRTRPNVPSGTEAFPRPAFRNGAAPAPARLPHPERALDTTRASTPAGASPLISGPVFTARPARSVGSDRPIRPTAPPDAPARSAVIPSLFTGKPLFANRPERLIRPESDE